MALDMDPELRRRLTELAAFHSDWAQQHQVDDEEWVPGGSSGPTRRPPSAQAEAEFVRRSREIMGRDPVTGSARTGVLPPARTRDEAHAYMDLRPCPHCGSVDTAWSSALAYGDDGVLVRRYHGACGNCGNEREFRFALPDRPTVAEPGQAVTFGGAEPSKLLDPGEWLLVADLCATAGAVADGDTPDDETRYSLAVAVAAMDEVIKFVPAGVDAVPDAAFTTSRGYAVYEREPGRFQRRRLVVVRDSYRESLARISTGGARP
jgi:hypothetical protein